MPPLGGVPGWFIRILFEDSRGFISKADARDVSPRLYFCSKTSVEEEAVLKEALEAMVSFFFFYIYRKKSFSRCRSKSLLLFRKKTTARR